MDFIIIGLLIGLYFMGYKIIQKLEMFESELWHIEMWKRIPHYLVGSKEHDEEFSILD